MKREFLETLFKESGLADDVVKKAIDDIMAENGKDIETEKAKTTAKDSELTKANETITGLQADIKKFDGVNVEELKTKASEWETRYNTDIQAEKEKAESIKKEYKLKEALKSNGAVDPEYLIFKQGGVDKFTFNSEGKVVGLDEILKPLKESTPNLFTNSNDSSVIVNSGGEHGQGGGKEPTTLRGALADAYK
ncbi:phage scaffolding protein [Anaerovorax sp. IOR16]|uniref:phage scaffolding protein n=1 Tax=Anaerovorax sp. IOR16 TaxID=2773458 RepID=UPI001FD6DE66|nr:phage scaffolding protein [Anaerovorax sp. IOR16]